MARHYLVDGYNVLLTDPELDELLDAEGLAAARRALREEATAFARRGNDRIRIVYDGAVDVMNHDDRFENSWVEDSFTTRDEKADERLVALALEYRRRGLEPVVVSDDRDGVRTPLLKAGFHLQSCADFARTLRSAVPELPRETRLSFGEREALARVFLARDAESRERAAAKAAATPRPAPPTPPPPPAAASPGAPVAPTTPPARDAPQRSAAEEARRKERRERGLRKQARRLALIQSRRPGR